MAEARSAGERRQRAWLPWALLASVGALGVGGGVLASRSISALLERTAQLEHEAAESEARVAELQVLRASLERRLRVLEQQQLGTVVQREGEAKRAREVDARMLRRETARLSLVAKLKDELAQEDAWLDTVGTEALRLELSERLLFEPGQATLTPRGAEVLARVGPVLAGVEGHAVEVASHTDEQPASPGGPAGTSWELSTARAATVVRTLQEGSTGMAPDRLSATGHASSRPVVPSDSPQNRLRNRRVTLTVLPMPPPAPAVAVSQEPVPPPLAPPAPPPPPPAKGGKKTARR